MTAQSAPPSNRTLTLLIASLGSFMVLLDGSIVFVALPEIQRDFGTQLSSLQWTVDAYTLPFAALMLTVGTLGDRFGRKKLFLLGLVLFLAGSALCGFATDLPMLIIGRIIQGPGAAAINTASLALLVSAFTDPPGRAKAIGIWTAVSGVSLALGPLVGGALINAFSWNAIFLVNLPIGGVALALGVVKLRESKTPEARRIDIPGQVLAASGLFCLILGLIEGERQGWGSPIIVGLLAGAALLIAGFVTVERRSSEPLLPLDLFRNRTFTVSCIIASLLGFVIVGSMFFMAQYYLSVQGITPLQAGLRLLPLTLGIFFFSPPASRIAGKVGPRKPVVIGAVLVTAGFLLLSTIGPDTGFASVWWKLALVGAGIGCMFAPLTVAVMGSTPPHRAGLGSSMINTTRIAGFTAGAAVLGTVVLARFRGEINSALNGFGVPPAASGKIADSIGGSGALAGSGSGGTAGLPVSPAVFRATIQESFVEAIHTVFYICAGCTALAAVLAAALMLRGLVPAPGRAAPRGQRPAGRDAAPAVETARPASSLLVDTDWAAQRLDQAGVVFVDCTAVHRSLPSGGVELDSGRAGYRKSHIPGAVFADLLTTFSDSTSRKPFGVLPPDQLGAQVERLGISSQDTVVLYDRAHGAFATWMWWQLASIGFDSAVVLDGGWTKWVADGKPVSADNVKAQRGTITVRPRPEVFSTREEVLAAIENPNVSILNALSTDQHDGLVPVANGRSGHIPTSANVPATELVDPSAQTYLPLPQLADKMRKAGAGSGPVITYCAAGVNASSAAFALRLLGVEDVAVYEGGLVEWAGDPELPLTSPAEAPANA